MMTWSGGHGSNRDSEGTSDSGIPVTTYCESTHGNATCYPNVCARSAPPSRLRNRDDAVRVRLRNMKDDWIRKPRSGVAIRRLTVRDHRYTHVSDSSFGDPSQDRTDTDPNRCSSISRGNIAFRTWREWRVFLPFTLAPAIGLLSRFSFCSRCPVVCAVLRVELVHGAGGLAESSHFCLVWIPFTLIADPDRARSTGPLIRRRPRGPRPHSTISSGRSDSVASTPIASRQSSKTGLAAAIWMTRETPRRRGHQSDDYKTTSRFNRRRNYSANRPCELSPAPPSDPSYLNIGTRRCWHVSRSRMVTVSSLSVSPSMVMQNGVPISSCRR